MSEQIDKKRHLFQKGNPGGPGRPKGKTIRARLASIAAEQIVIDGVKLTKGEAILRRIVNGALAADPVQQKYYLEYMYGKPTQPIEVDATLAVAQYDLATMEFAQKFLAKGGDDNEE